MKHSRSGNALAGVRYRWATGEQDPKPPWR